MESNDRATGIISSMWFQYLTPDQERSIIDHGGLTRDEIRDIGIRMCADLDAAARAIRYGMGDALYKILPWRY